VYDTLRVRGGRPLWLREHLRRLGDALRRLHYPRVRSAAQFGAIVRNVIRKNKLVDAAVRITVTRGPGGAGLDPRLCKHPTVLVTGRPFAGYPATLIERGIVLALVNVQRNTPRSTPPGVKNTSCLNMVLAKIESVQMGADEALLLDHKGNVAEGSVSNIFIVRNGALLTPRLHGHQLPGVTRALVIKAARSLKIAVREQTVHPAALFSADEIFVTNALMNVMPVRTLLWRKNSKPIRRKFSGNRLTTLLKNSFAETT
jgi:branched-chain amino acid aminotransferase